MARFAAKPPQQDAQQKSRIEPIRLRAATIPGHSYAVRMDDVRLNAAYPKPARQPEPITSGRIGDDAALDLAAALPTFVTPTIYDREETIGIRLELFQRLTFDSGKQPADEPRGLAHLDDNNKGAL